MPGPLQLFPRISDFYHRWYNDAFLNLQKMWSYAKLQFTWSIFLFRAWDMEGRGLFYKYYCQSNDQKIIYMSVMSFSSQKRTEGPEVPLCMEEETGLVFYHLTDYSLSKVMVNLTNSHVSSITNRQKARIFSSKACLILNWAKKAILGWLTFIPLVLLGRLLHSLFKSVTFWNILTVIKGKCGEAPMKWNTWIKLITSKRIKIS